MHLFKFQFFPFVKISVFPFSIYSAVKVSVYIISAYIASFDERTKFLMSVRFVLGSKKTFFFRINGPLLKYWLL